MHMVHRWSTDQCVTVQVENYVVGAPCGVMDQMASSLGDQQALMAMSCQPAEVEPEVPIPPHLKFWGLDSGGSRLCTCVLQAYLTIWVSLHHRLDSFQ